MKIQKMSEEDARIICSWQYSDEYSIYNYPSWDNIVANNWAIADSNKRDLQFRKIVGNDNYLIGYFRFVKNNDKISIGLGMNPEICGHGNGNEFIKTILSYKELKNSVIELEVRTFNKRAINCYLDCGFEIISKEFKKSEIGDDEFYIMHKNN